MTQLDSDTGLAARRAAAEAAGLPPDRATDFVMSSQGVPEYRPKAIQPTQATSGFLVDALSIIFADYQPDLDSSRSSRKKKK